MLRIMLKSKIHNAIVTETRLHYEGSITIDKTLMELADLFSGEQVQVLNLNTGDRIETYVIEGEHDSGTICLNGPAARVAQVGDTVIILSYVLVDTDECVNFKSKLVYVDKNNKVVEVK